MKAMSCSQCRQTWQVEMVLPGGWRLRESPEPWAYGWLISAERPCCPFDGADLLVEQEATLEGASVQGARM